MSELTEKVEVPGIKSLDEVAFVAPALDVADPFPFDDDLRVLVTCALPLPAVCASPAAVDDA